MFKIKWGEKTLSYLDNLGFLLSKRIIKESLILTKPASYGLQVSLNKNKLKEIEEFIKKILGFKFY